MDIDALVEKIEKATVSGKKLATALSGGETPAGAFRVKWLRRLLLAWWWIAALITLACLVLDFIAINRGLGGMAIRPRMPGGFDPGALGYFYLQSFGFLNFFCDVWVALALFFLARVWCLRTAREGRAVKALWVFAAVAVVFGRWTSFLWGFLYAFVPEWSLLWHVKYLLLPPVFLFIAGCFQLVSLYFAFMLAFTGLVWFPIKVFSSVNRIMEGLHIIDVMAVPVFGALVRFWFWFTGKKIEPVEQAPDDSRGARFATNREIVTQEIAGLENPRAAIFGHTGQNSPLPLYTDKHVLIMASTRSGKGVSLIIPHLLRYQGSAFVLDPKGENARASGRRRATLNGAVYCLDPFGISGKPQSRFNPLARFTPENMEAESKALAAALVMGEGGKRDHWTASGQQLLAALILYVYASPDFQPGEKDLPTVRRLLLASMDSVLPEMAKSPVAGGLVSDLAQSFLKTPEKELGSIISTAQRETEILDNPCIARCLSASGEGEEVDFSVWRTGTMTVYLCLSAPKFPVFNRWLRLVLTSALDEMTDTLNPPPLPVCFMLDELATLGHLQAVENAVGLAAGYGIQLFTIFQDVAQMRDLYKGRWASFIGNAGVRALFNLDDYDTAKYWSNFMGGHLVETTSQSQDVHGLVRGQSKGETIRPLLSPEDIMLQFAKDEMLVLPQGSHPIRTKRVPYWKDATLAGLWDDPRLPLPPKPAAPRPAARPQAPAPPLLSTAQVAEIDSHHFPVKPSKNYRDESLQPQTSQKKQSLRQQSKGKSFSEEEAKRLKAMMEKAASEWVSES